ncbi:BTB/POZ domain-containing protein 2-like [Diaphorina citri]|uniref:BTB/POZ domain-containing protein 2-like n=1 Tax=Diaphorina citri TaxID=121845 RepID=A0A3Q0IS30_DIACI|nr:BTB/POZ domain-containing protein 2-like [Diaphorina citri]
MTGKEQVVHRFQHIESRWGYSGTSDRIRFSVDRRIFVVGFGLYGCIHGPTEYDVQMQLVRTANGKVIAGNRTSFACDGSTFTSRVMFKEPVEVMPNISYTACATLKVHLTTVLKDGECRHSDNFTNIVPTCQLHI